MNKQEWLVVLGKAIGTLGYLIVEYKLGQSEKGSVLGLAIKAVSSILKRPQKDSPPDGVVTKEK